MHPNGMPGFAAQSLMISTASSSLNVRLQGDFVELGLWILDLG